MNINKLFLCIMLLIFFAVATWSQTTQKHEVLFEKAKYTMETKGDLKGAIKLFNQIVKKYPEQRKYAAMAMIHIGFCNEKLGLEEAQKSYQVVIDQYPDQKKEVSLAKERLTRLVKFVSDSQKAQPVPEFKKIHIPVKPGNGALSPDGKKLVFASDGSLWIVPLSGKVSSDIAGEPVRLPGTEGAWRSGMCWSADSRWIVYNTHKNGSVGICVVPSSGGEVKTLVREYDAGRNINNYGLGISPDGKIVAYASKVKDKLQLFTASVADGVINHLTMDGGLQPAFSPDGDKIAYVKEKPVKTDIRKSDVWVLPIKGGPAVQVSDLPGRATRPIWSPDGKMIAFTRKAERGDNSKEICIAQVSESDNVGMTLTQIELPLETWDFLAGWTPDNKIGLLLTNPEHHAIYTVSTTGGKATQVAHQGETYHPSWSPDGERIYFRWMHGDIAYVPSDGGKISKGILDSDSIFVSLPGGGNVISPDGEKIVFSGYKIIYKDEKRDYEVDLYTMPAKGGKPTKITVSPGQDRFPCWSPDGKSIVFIRYPEPNKIKEVCIVPTQGGEVRKLTSESDSVKWSDVAWSPDGKLIAYFTEDKFIKVIPVQGGESRIVVKVEDVSMHNEMAWSRDEEELVYSSEGKLYVVSIDNGKPEEIKTGLDGWASHVSLSPDGKKIAFTASKGGDAEFWFMDDFLPLEKLAAKEKPKSSIDQKGMTIKQVWAGPDVNIAGEISPDGKYLSCTEYKTSGDLSIREIVTGKKRHLTSEADWTNFEIAHSSRWSPDGRKLVYAWSIGNGNELRLIGLDGSKPRILYKNKELNCNPQDWTPDGKKILATFSGNDENFQIGLISVADGSVRILKTLDKPHFPHTSVSLDGRNVVYDFPPKEGSWERDIFLISIDGKREIPLIKHDADDRLIDWTPDGKSILFISDRTGTYDMWRIHVADGNPQADPELIKKDIGDIQPMGFTQQGSFYYGTHLNTMDVFTAKLDLEKSVILSPPKEITQRFIGSNLTPDWSPDGEYLAYMSIRDTEQKGSNTFVLSIRSEQTGQVREIYPQIEGSWLLRWSPDGQSIFIATAPKMWAQGLYRIDIQNGDMTPVAQSEPGSIIKIFTFSPNGKFVYYVYYQWKKKVTSIISHELKTGKEKKVYYRDKEAFSDIRGLLVSPDGQYLSIGPEESEDNHLIKIIPIDGGEPKNLFIMKSDHPGQSGEYVWIPNGKEILFVKEISIMDKKMWELWQVPVNGGESRKIGLSKKRMIVPSFHPDGKRITFFTFKSSEEVWVIENFLPEKQDRR